MPVPDAYGTSCWAVRRRVGHRLGREDDQQPVAAGVAGDDLERGRIALGRCVADDVDGVAVAPGRRQDRVERSHRVGRELGASLPPPRMSASVASTPGPPALLSTVRRGPLGQGLLAEDLGEVEEVGDALGAQDADAPEGRVEDLVAAGQRARCARPPLATPPRCGPAS